VRNIGSAIAVAIAIASVAPALAADLPTKKPAPAPAPVPARSEWRYDLSVYGWALNVTGNAGVGPFPTKPVYASFDDILRHLDGAFFADAHVSNGTFIGGLDFIWARLGTDVTYDNLSRPLLYGTGADLRLNVAFLAGFGGLRIPIGPPNLELYGIGGARYLNEGLSVKLNIPVVGFDASASITKDWADPIVGLVGHYRIDDKWFVNGEADIGGLDNSATGQGLGAVGYNWTQNIATTVGYRVMYAYDKQNTATGSFRAQEWLYGLFAAIKFAF